VAIRSVPGQGTEVTLMLPGSNQQETREEHRPRPEQQGAGEHVLVVEDMACVRLSVAEVLADAGYRCTLAETIEQALDHLREDADIALLLTDVGLPGISGRDLADMARTYRPGLPVLFMTGYAETALDRQTFLDTGMDLLIKPFQIGELLDKVRLTLGQVK